MTTLTVIGTYAICVALLASVLRAKNARTPGAVRRAEDDEQAAFATKAGRNLMR